MDKHYDHDSFLHFLPPATESPEVHGERQMMRCRQCHEHRRPYGNAATGCTPSDGIRALPGTRIHFLRDAAQLHLSSLGAIPPPQGAVLSSPRLLINTRPIERPTMPCRAPGAAPALPPRPGTLCAERPGRQMDSEEQEKQHNADGLESQGREGKG